MKKIIILIFLILYEVLSIQIHACSTFFLKNGNHLVTGRNFDYSLFDYLVFINKRNIKKTAFEYSEGNLEIKKNWISKYGSITFNISGCEFATDGINEKGLVVTALVLKESEYTIIDNTPTINVDQWVQYMLDNFSTVGEAVEAFAELNIRINPYDFWRLHLFVTDRFGNNAVIEFINGELVIHTGQSLEKNAISNSTYDESIRYYQRGIVTGNTTSSLNRYFKMAKLLDDYSTENIIDYSYAILDSIQQSHTNRKIVYDITNMRIYLKSYNNHNIRQIDLNDFDFSCSGPALVYKESLDDFGNIYNKFIPYSQQINKLAIEKVWKYLNKTYTENELDNFSHFPELYACATTSVDDIVKNGQIQLKIYPNPVYDILNVSIETKNSTNLEYSIYNIKGQSIALQYRNYRFTNNPFRINVSDLKYGEYIIRIKIGKDIQCIKFNKF